MVVAYALGASGAALANEPTEPDTEKRERAQLSLTEDIEARYYTGEAVEDPYFEQVSRTNLGMRRGPWTAGLQLDQVWLAGTAYIDEFGIETQAVDLLAPETRSPFDSLYVNPEKVYVTTSGADLELRLGDFYTTFGRGMSLSLGRNVDIDIDTSLLGASLVGHTERLSFTVLSGLTNPQQVNQDNRNQEIDPGLAHVVHGARAELWGVGPLNFGLHAVSFTLAPTNDFGQDWGRYARTPSVLVSGANVGALLFGGNVDAYIEGARLLPIATPVGEDPLVAGWALYSSVAVFAGPFVFLAEGKRYTEMEDINRLSLFDGYELLAPPSLEYERAITEDSSAAVNSSDITGGRLRMDWVAVPGKTIPYLSVAAYRDLTVDDGLHFNATPETIVHPLVGVEQYGLGDLSSFHVFANAGLRIDRRDLTAEGSDLSSDVQAHFDVAAGPWPNERGLELAVAYERFLWGDNAFQQTDYTEIEGSLSWHLSAPLVLVAYLDYSDNPLVKGGAFGSPGNLGENLYGAGESSTRWPSAHS